MVSYSLRITILDLLKFIKHKLVNIMCLIKRKNIKCSSYLIKNFSILFHANILYNCLSKYNQPMNIFQNILLFKNSICYLIYCIPVILPVFCIIFSKCSYGTFLQLKKIYNYICNMCVQYSSHIFSGSDYMMRIICMESMYLCFSCMPLVNFRALSYKKKIFLFQVENV